MSKRKSRIVHRVSRIERVEATPETKAKLQQDWRLTILSVDHQTAADRILAAYSILTSGLGAKVADFTRTDRASSHENIGEEILERQYREWWHACARLKRNVSRVHGVLVDPLSEVRDVGSHRIVISPDTGCTAMIGDIEACLDEYVRLSGGRVIDRKTA